MVNLSDHSACELQLQPIAVDGVILGVLVMFRSPEALTEMIEIPFATSSQQGSLQIDLLRHRATLDDTRLDLTTTEFGLLAYLIEHQGAVQTREELLKQVWGHKYPGHSRTVDTHIRRLREKLAGASCMVETVRGMGYRFRVNERSR